MVRRRYRAFAALVAAGLLVSCGAVHASSTSKPWWSRMGGGNCGTPGLVNLDGRVMPVGDCAALLTIPALKVTMQVGQQIDVHLMQEDTGAGTGRMIPIYPLPHSSHPSVLTSGAVSADKATQTYRALQPGQAVLISHGLCLDRHRKRPEFTGSCPVIVVTVDP